MALGPDVQGSPLARFRGGILLPLGLEGGQVVPAGGGLGAPRTKIFLPDLQRAAVLRFGLLITTLADQRAREIVQVDGEIRMLRAERLFADGLGAPKKGQGLGISILQTIDVREVTQAGGGLGGVRL